MLHLENTLSAVEPLLPELLVREDWQGWRTLRWAENRILVLDHGQHRIFLLEVTPSSCSGAVELPSGGWWGALKVLEGTLVLSCSCAGFGLYTPGGNYTVPLSPQSTVGFTHTRGNFRLEALSPTLLLYVGEVRDSYDDLVTHTWGLAKRSELPQDITLQLRMRALAHYPLPSER